MRFLIDECLTVKLVTVAGQAGYEAHHVAHLGKAGWKDWNITQYACAEEFVLVTNNAVDFQRLYAAQALHPGLVIIIPTVAGELQERLFAGAIEQLVRHGEPINQVLEIDLAGEDVAFTFYEFPSPG